MSFVRSEEDLPLGPACKSLWWHWPPASLPKRLQSAFYVLVETTRRACHVYLWLSASEDGGRQMTEGLLRDIFRLRTVVKDLDASLTAARARCRLPLLPFMGATYDNAFVGLLQFAEYVAAELVVAISPEHFNRNDPLPVDPALGNLRAFSPEPLSLPFVHDAVCRHFREAVRLPDPGRMLKEARREICLLAESAPTEPPPVPDTPLIIEEAPPRPAAPAPPPADGTLKYDGIWLRGKKRRLTHDLRKLLACILVKPFPSYDHVIAECALGDKEYMHKRFGDLRKALQRELKGEAEILDIQADRTEEVVRWEWRRRRNGSSGSLTDTH